MSGTGDGDGRGPAAAGSFDRRTAPPDAAAAAVAAAILGRLPSGEPGLLLEIGAGTGVIGRHLAASCRGYAGLDRSLPLLRAFAARLPPGMPAALMLADADRGWPLRDASAAAVLAGRVAHQLDLPHLAQECRRVLRPGGLAAFGHVARDRDGVKERLRRRRLDLLRPAAGPGGQEGDRRREAALRDALVAVGARPAGRLVAASWTSRTSARQVIAAWGETDRAAGAPIPPDRQATLLADVARWAATQPEGLDSVQEDAESYILDLFILPGPATAPTPPSEPGP